MPRHALHRYVLQHPSVVRAVTRWRYRYFTKVLRRPVRCFDVLDDREADDPLVRTYRKNIAFLDALADRRSFRLIKAASCVSGFRRDMRVLFVGPRNEQDILSLYAFGYDWKSIRGFDLFSYSPKIDVGDMHELPYDDGSYDLVFSAWALTYSDDPRRACNELVRVARPGGIIAVGCTRADGSIEDRWKRRGERPCAHCWIEDLDALKACFGPGLGTVLWAEQAPTWGGGDRDNLSVVFRVSKPAPAAKVEDSHALHHGHPEYSRTG